MTLSDVHMHDIAVAVAQQNAMERSLRFLPHGSRLFDVVQGWESRVIRSDAAVAVAETMLDLERVLRDPGRSVIFIPQDAMIAFADIEKLCARNAVAKTIFREIAR